MRTTIDLPDDLHRLAMALASDRGTTLSRAVVELMRRGLAPSRTAGPAADARTGLPLVRLGTPVSSEDVRAVDDDA